MRILFDARVLIGSARHGIARHTEGVLRALAVDPGRHQYLILARQPEAVEKALAPAGPGSSFELRLFDAGPYSPRGQAGLPGHLLAAKPDLYYSPTYLPPLFSPCPLAFTIHDLIHLDFPGDYSFSHRLVWRLFIAPRARRAKAILTVSQATADRIAGTLGVALERIEVIGNGVGPEFRPRGLKERAAVMKKLELAGPYLVALGNPRPHKNLADAVAAFQQLARQGLYASLVLVGWGEAPLPAGPGRVIQAQGLDDAELAALYSGSLAGLFPSLAEGFGLPPLEALACGCPVVASDLPVMREVLGPEGAEFVPPADVSALAKAVAGLADDPQQAKAKAEVGLAGAARHNWAEAAGRLRALFDRLEPDIENKGS